MKLPVCKKEGINYPRYWLVNWIPKDIVIIEEYMPNNGIVLYSESQTVSNGNLIYMDQISNPIEIERSHLPKSLQHFNIEELRKNEPQYFY